MMPKGVEHSVMTSDCERRVIVKIPMTPKGVEHKRIVNTSRQPQMLVKIPMMLKGVEHAGHDLEHAKARPSVLDNTPPRKDVRLLL